MPHRLPPPPPPTFVILSAQATMNNDPLYLTFAFKDGVLLLYLPLKKNGNVICYQKSGNACVLEQGCQTSLLPVGYQTLNRPGC